MPLNMADPKQVTKTTETHTTITQIQGNPAPAGIAPVTNTLSAAWVTEDTARLEGEVTPNKAPTQYWFEYGTTPNLGATTAPMSAGEGQEVVPVSVIIAKADHTAVQYFRLVAENKFGKVAGALHTLQALVVPQKQAAPAAAVQERSSLLYNIVATVGLIIVLIVLIWGLFHLATLLSPWFSSLFTSKTTAPQALHVSAPASATSGTPITVSWSYTTTAKGTYAFLYSCNDSLRFETAGTGGTTNAIPCGAAFTVSGSSVKVTPTLSGTKSINEPLSILFVPSQAGAEVQGGATVTINPAAVSAPAVSQSVSATHAGPADLSVVILSAVVDQTGLATVVFDIANGGTGDSGSYNFQAYLPTRTTYTYSSPVQSSLAPGSHIVNTLRFTQATPGAVSIIVDPSSSVNDSNRTNNYAAQNLSMPYGYNPQTYYNNYNGVTPIYYGQQPYVY